MLWERWEELWAVRRALKRWETLPFLDRVYFMFPVCVVPACYRPGSFYSSVVAYPHLAFMRGSCMLSVEIIFTATEYFQVWVTTHGAGWICILIEVF